MVDFKVVLVCAVDSKVVTDVTDVVVVVGDVLLVVNEMEVEIRSLVTSTLETLVSMKVVSSAFVVKVDGVHVNLIVKLWVVVALVFAVKIEKFGSWLANVSVDVVPMVVDDVVVVRVVAVPVVVSSKRTWLLDMTMFKI